MFSDLSLPHVLLLLLFAPVAFYGAYFAFAMLLVVAHFFLVEIPLDIWGAIADKKSQHRDPQ